MQKNNSLEVILLSLLVMGHSQLAQAQQITTDGNTATIVTQNGNKFIIDGNTLSSDGKNLFHSLQEFGLSSGQIAEFLTNPSIKNILTRITGGNPSYIDGLIQVTGGNSNLFIMNPAGMIFSDGASLNVLGDFTATTSTGIGFANGIFNAVGTNDYQALTGDPTSFVFNTSNPGSIVNTGNLTLADGKNFTVVAGNIINTGTITTKNGNINIQAVEGTSRVKITPKGSLLSLEIEPPQDQLGNPLPFASSDLATLLTGGNDAGVTTTEITVNSATGNAEVAGLAVPNDETGIAVFSGTLDVSSDTATGGDITILGNKVALIDADVNANGVTGGGKIKIGGDQEGLGTIPNSSLTIVDADTTVEANALENGDGGEIIVFSEGSALIDGQLTAKGGEFSGNGGFIETSGKQFFSINSVPDTSAVNGNAGTWLIDPSNIEIVQNSTSGSQFFGTINDGALEFRATVENSQISIGSIQAGLASNDTVRIVTSPRAFSGSFPEFDAEGDIVWGAGVTFDYDGLGTDKTLILQADRNIEFNGSILDGDINNIEPDSLNLEFNSSGDTIINGSLQVNSITTDIGGRTIINNGGISTTGNQTYNDDVIIGDDLTLATTNNGAITFGNTVNSEAGESNDLTLNSGSGNLSFNGAVGNSQALADINANTTGTTNFNSTVNANSLTTNAGGITQLSGNVITAQNQTYNDEVNILNSLELTSNQGRLEFQNNVNAGVNDLTLTSLTGLEIGDNATPSGSGNLTIQTSTGDRNIIIGEAIPGVSNPFILSDLTNFANGFHSITIGNNSTTNIITINEILTVQDPLTLQASEIFVNQDINGIDNASITFIGDGSTTTLDADITTQGQPIVIEDNVIVSNNVTLDSNGGLIGVFGSINSISGENNSLTVDAGSGNFILTGNIGDIQALNNLLVTASQANLNSPQIQTIGSQEFNSNILLLNDSTQFNSGSTFTSGAIFSSGGDLNIDSAGNIRVSYIDTGNSESQAGNITIKTLGILQVTDTIPGTNISINATGGNDSQSGTILIDFFPDGEGSVERIPFVVNTSVNEDTNGTAGIITNGISTVQPGSYVTTIREEKITVRLLDPVEELDPATLETINTNPDTIALEKPPQSNDVIDTVAEVQELLTAIEEETENEQGEAEKPALIYVSFTPKGYRYENLDQDLARRELTSTQEYSKVGIDPKGFQPTFTIEPQDDDLLDILIVTAQGEPLRVTVPVTRKEFVQNSEDFWIAISDVFTLNDSYKSSASNLYNWLIKPLEEDLQKREITNLVFILPTQVRFIPVSALYDEQEDKFLVEKYSSGLAPSLNLNNNDYRSLKDLKLLAMGASEFADSSVVPLPAASLELPTIKDIWGDEQLNDFQPYTNENFNLNKIKSNVSNQPYGIIHFGTHGDFNPDEISESYIQLYNSRLGLDDIRQLGLNEPLVELMVLSACETAFGDEIAELGFAGLAVKAGVKSAMGSVWQVSDTGTLALMTDFYTQLKKRSTKAQALRQAQLSLLNKKIYKTEDGKVIVTPERNISLEELPPESRQAEDFSHPFYWAPFTMIGNPW